MGATSQQVKLFTLNQSLLWLDCATMGPPVQGQFDRLIQAPGHILKEKEMCALNSNRLRYVPSSLWASPLSSKQHPTEVRLWVRKVS